MPNPLKILLDIFSTNKKSTTSISEDSYEKTDEGGEYNLFLKNIGTSKIQVIKIIREITGYGLKEAKDIADYAPSLVKKRITEAKAMRYKEEFEKVGAIAEVIREVDDQDRSAVDKQDNSILEDGIKYNLFLKDPGPNKIQVIKIIRDITGYELKESKEILDYTPSLVKKSIKGTRAMRYKEEFEQAGALVELVKEIE